MFDTKSQLGSTIIWNKIQVFEWVEVWFNSDQDRDKWEKSLNIMSKKDLVKQLFFHSLLDIGALSSHIGTEECT